VSGKIGKIKEIVVKIILIIFLFFGIVLSPFITQTQEHIMESGSPLSISSANKQEIAENPPEIMIPAEKQQLIGVKTIEVSFRPLQKIIRTVGRIEYDERKLVTITTKYEGWIERLYGNYTGKYVKKGEPLAEIYSPELFATQQEFINLIRWSKNQNEGNFGKMLDRDIQAILQAARERLRLWDITEAQIKKIEESRKPIKTLTIHSPVEGYIIQKSALQGARVMSGEKLFDLADLSTVWVIADIYEDEIPLIKVGDNAKINLSYFPEKEFYSKIDFIYPSLSEETRTIKVRFILPNPGGQLKPSMYTNVQVKIDRGVKLAIPTEAVIDTGERQIVYVDRGEGNFEPREVKTGVKAGSWVEVIRGLKPGEKIVAAANFLIDSEAKLKGIVPLHQH